MLLEDIELIDSVEYLSMEVLDGTNFSCGRLRTSSPGRRTSVSIWFASSVGALATLVGGTTPGANETVQVSFTRLEVMERVVE